MPAPYRISVLTTSAAYGVCGSNSSEMAAAAIEMA